MYDDEEQTYSRIGSYSLIIIVPSFFLHYACIPPTYWLFWCGVISICCWSWLFSSTSITSNDETLPQRFLQETWIPRAGSSCTPAASTTPAPCPISNGGDSCFLLVTRHETRRFDGR